MKVIYDVDNKNSLEVQNAELTIKLLKIKELIKDVCKFNLGCKNQKCINCQYSNIDYMQIKGLKQISDVIEDNDIEF